MLSGRSPWDISKTPAYMDEETYLFVQTALLPKLYSPFEVKVKPLRPYQQEALEAFLKVKRGTLEHATALGKTVTAMAVMKQVNKPTAIVVPTIAILETVWFRRLKESGWRDIGLFYGERKDVRSITVFTYQSAIRYPQLLAKFRVIIFDEAHHLRAKEYATLLPYAQAAEYALGLTATIDAFDVKNHEVLRVMPIIHRMPIAKAREEGWVSEIKVFSNPAQMAGPERDRYEELTNIIHKAVSRLGTPDPTQWAKMAAGGNPAARQGLWALSKRRVLLSGVHDKILVLHSIVKRYPGEKVLVFSESIASIEIAKNYLLAHGVKCNVYHSEIPQRWKPEILRSWDRGSFNVLLSVTALEEGLDVASASVGVIHTSGRTPRKIVQRIGRIIRPLPGKVAKIHVIYCPGTVESQVVNAVQRAVTRVK